MIIQMVSPYNTNFTARLTSESRRCMNEILTPMVDKFLPVNEMAKQTIYTQEQINRWARRKYGMTVTQLYKTKQNKIIQKEFLEYEKNNTPIKEVSKQCGHSENWVRMRYDAMGIDTHNKKQRQYLAENVPWMLDAGYTIKRMQSELNVSVHAILGWINQEMGCSVREYKKAHDIHKSFK